MSGERFLAALQWWLQGQRRAQQGRPLPWGWRMRSGNAISDLRYWLWRRQSPNVTVTMTTAINDGLIELRNMRTSSTNVDFIYTDRTNR